jgi:hypothetical protein
VDEVPEPAVHLSDHAHAWTTPPDCRLLTWHRLAIRCLAVTL